VLGIEAPAGFHPKLRPYLSLVVSDQMLSNHEALPFNRHIDRLPVMQEKKQPE